MDDATGQALDDLVARFIVNLPDEELKTFQRIGFHLEQAHWYYIDFLRERNPMLPELSWKRFVDLSAL